MSLRVAFVGASGLVGQPVAEELLRAGYELTLLGRRPDALRRRFPGARVERADLRDPASLLPALRDQDMLYLNLSVRQDERPGDFHTETDGLRALLPLARQAGIQRVAYLSSLVMRYQGTGGFRWWVFDVKHEAIRLLRESGLPILLFYPSTFLESFQMQRIGPLLLLPEPSPVRMGFIAGRDYGQQVARALALPEGTSREFVVQGPEQLTYAEAARRYAAACARPLRPVTMPLKPLKIMGRLNQRMQYAAHILEALNGYPEVFEAEATWRVLGTPQTTVEAFARREG